MVLVKFVLLCKIMVFDIFDFLLYFECIEGFGVEKFYYLFFIVKKGDGGWVLENVDFGLWFIDLKGEMVVILFDGCNLDKFCKEVE